MDTYSIIFSGEVASEKDVTQVKQNLAKLYKVPVTTVEAWFSGKNMVIQKHCDYTKAIQIKKAFETTGAICHIKPEQKKKNPKKPKMSPQSSSPSSSDSSLIVCPKCGFKQPKTLECVRCGIMIQKYLEKKEEEKLTARSEQKSLSEEPSPSPNMSKEKKPAHNLDIEHKKKNQKNKNIMYIVVGAVIFALVIIIVTYQIFENRARQQAEEFQKQLEALQKKQEEMQAEEARKQQKEILNAVYIAIKKVEGSVNSGVTYQDYSSLVSVVRTEIDIVKNRIATNDVGKLNTLIDAYNEYQSAKALWSAKLQDNKQEVLSILESLPGELCPPQSSVSEIIENCSNAALQYYWKKASVNIRQYEEGE